MNIQLSDHFTYRKLFRFTIPSIVMMIITSMYSVIDGLFIANVVGSNALSAINIIFPLTMIVGAFGFMFGTGGSAIVARTFGEGEKEKANKYFSTIIYTIIAVGLILSAACVIFIKPLAVLLGASKLLLPDCITYGRVMLAGCVPFMLQTSFQTFFIVAEKPHLGLTISILSGITNIILDFIFIYVLKLGVLGAGLATVCGYLVGGIVPLIYFFIPRDNSLKLGKTKFYPKMLLECCINGSSEMMTNISSSIVSILYNIQLMKIVGESGVAALTVMLYVNFIFISAFIGFAMGQAPIISYNYGAENHSELKNVYKKGIIIIGSLSLIMTISAQLLANTVAHIFVGSDPELMQMTVGGFRLFAISFMFCGLNIFGSSFFTALCNGKISALISFLRTLVFQAGMLILLPLWLGLDGVWISVSIAEGLAAAITIIFLIAKKKEYNYV